MKASGAAAIAWVALALTGFPLVMLGVTGLGLDSRGLTLPYRVLILAGAMAILVSFKRRGLRVTSLSGGALIVSLAFFAVYTAKMVYILWYSNSSVPAPPLEYILYAVGGCFLPALAASLLRFRFNEAHLVTTLFAVLLASNVGWLLSVRDVMGTDFGRLRAIGFNQIQLGHAGVSLILVAIVWAFCLRSSLQRKMIAIAAIAVGVGVILLAASRGPIVALGLCLSVLAASLIKRRFYLVMATAFVGAAVTTLFGSAIIALIGSTGSGVVDRVANTFKAGAGLEGRAEIYSAALSQTVAHPWVGGHFLIYDTWPHSMILEAYAFLGIFGGTLFLILLLLLLYSAILVLRSGRWLVVPILFIQSLVHYMLSGAIWQAVPFWVGGGLLIGLLLRKEDVCAQ